MHIVLVSFCVRFLMSHLYYMGQICGIKAVMTHLLLANTFGIIHLHNIFFSTPECISTVDLDKPSRDRVKLITYVRFKCCEHMAEI